MVSYQGSMQHTYQQLIDIGSLRLIRDTVVRQNSFIHSYTTRRLIAAIRVDVTMSSSELSVLRLQEMFMGWYNSWPDRQTYDGASIRRSLMWTTACG